MAGRGLPVPRLEERHAHLVVGHHGVGLQLDGPLQVRDGLGVAALARARDPELELRDVDLGIRGHDLLEQGDGAVELPVLHRDHRVVQGVGHRDLVLGVDAGGRRGDRGAADIAEGGQLLGQRGIDGAAGGGLASGGAAPEGLHLRRDAARHGRAVVGQVPLGGGVGGHVVQLRARRPYEEEPVGAPRGERAPAEGPARVVGLRVGRPLRWLRGPGPGEERFALHGRGHGRAHRLQDGGHHVDEARAHRGRRPARRPRGSLTMRGTWMVPS